MTPPDAALLGCRSTRSASAAPRPRARPGLPMSLRADGDVRDLVRLIAAAATPREGAVALSRRRGSRRRSDAASWPRAASRPNCASSIAPSTAPFPPELRRRWRPATSRPCCIFPGAARENYMAGARDAGIAEPALAVRHYCLSDAGRRAAHGGGRRAGRGGAAPGRGRADRAFAVIAGLIGERGAICVIPWCGRSNRD